MNRKPSFNVLPALLIFTVLSILFSGPAAGTSYVYDPFTTAASPAPGSDPNWVDDGPNTGFFSMPGNGSLYFSDPYPGGNWDELKSTTTISGAFFVSMQYSTTSVNNTEPLGIAGVGSSVQFLLMSSLNGVRIAEFNQGATPSNPAGTFMFNGATLQGDTVTKVGGVAGVASGWLGIYYNGVAGPGGQATVWYNTGTGWTQLGGPGYTLYPDFAGDPHIRISGVDTDGNYLSFNVSDLTISTTGFPSVPLPSSLLLLAPGLVGFVTMRRRLKK
jgi:hypothetical protein